MLSPDARIQISRSREPASELARRFGVSVATIHRARQRSDAPRPPSNRERFLELAEGSWRAACMDEADWRLWVERNPLNLADAQVADRPCRDCPASFAAEMRAIGRCNGRPRGTEAEPRDPDEREDEEDDVIDQRSSGGVRAAAPVELTAPPCATCAHEPICVLKIALGKTKTAEVSMPPLPDGLTVAVSARVDCRFYERRKGVASARAPWTPERRAAHSEQMRARMAAGFVVGRPKA